MKDSRDFNRETGTTLLSYDCLDCYNIMTAPDKHGRCARCQSRAVAARAVITLDTSVPSPCMTCKQPISAGQLVSSDFARHTNCNNPRGGSCVAFELPDLPELSELTDMLGPL